MTMFFITIFSLYAVFVCLLIVGWNKAMSFVPGTDQEFDPFVSIIIAARNESQRISPLLKDLSAQRKANFEVIVVDDRSEDDTFAIVNNFTANDHRFKVLGNKGIGKKEAITTGIEFAAGSIIVTTDADCRVGPSWAYNMCRPFTDQKIMMVFGSVKMQGKSFFDQLQAQEFVSLIGSAAATAGLGKPVLCNGANLSFRRSAFLEVEGYHGNFDVASGDDEFLMRKIVAKYPKPVCFSSDSHTVVRTSTSSSVDQFVHQRLRWASKWGKHTDMTSRGIALFVFAFQLSTLILISLTLLGSINATIAISLFATKILVEALFISKVNRFLGLRFNTWAFIVLQVIYPFYVLTIGLLCNFMNFEWKGRRHTNSASITVGQRPDYLRR
jgi:biofilm PGA synthesis N-glycosyltransferase PgaC